MSSHSSFPDPDARTVAECIAIFHDGGASSLQLATVLGWEAARLQAALDWLVARDYVSVSGDADPDWPYPYLRQNARTAELLPDG